MPLQKFGKHYQVTVISSRKSFTKRERADLSPQLKQISNLLSRLKRADD
jgi:hypothetical protein